jgi:phosphopentomutase
MINRVILLVIDGFGAGALPDAAKYGDAEANTMVNLADAVGGLSLPNLEALGLGHVAQIKGVRTMAQPNGCFGRLGFMSQGKDSVVGYWETSGVIVREGWAKYASGIPADVTAVFEQVLGRKVIGNRVASMTTMLQEYGVEHVSSRAPILWTDGGNTCYLAVHEFLMPPAEFQQRCREAWKAVKGTGVPIRIVAQPVTGEAGSFRPHAGRKDFVSEPPDQTMLDVLNRSSQITMGIGKVYDLFSGRGLTRAFPSASAIAAFDETVGMMNKVPRGLLYVSLDLLPEDANQAAIALQEFDRRLPDLFDKLRIGDLVMLTGDHGRDVSRPGKTPTREYVPVVVTGPKLAQGVDLGTRATAADLGQTIVDAMRAERLPIGDSFFEALRSG